MEHDATGCMALSGPLGEIGEVDGGEMWRGLQALFAAQPHLFSEVFDLFLADEPRFEPGGIYNYLFAIAPTPADGAGNRYLAFRPRDESERRAVLLASDEHGLVPLRAGATENR